MIIEERESWCTWHRSCIARTQPHGQEPTRPNGAPKATAPPSQLRTLRTRKDRRESKRRESGRVMGEVGMKREIEEDGDGHHRAKLREAVTVGKVGKRVDSEEHREDSGRIERDTERGQMQALAMEGRGDRGKERFGMGREGLTRDWLLKDREATQTGAGEYEGTATSTPRCTRTRTVKKLLSQLRYQLSQPSRWWRVPPIVALS